MGEIFCLTIIHAPIYKLVEMKTAEIKNLH